MTLQYIEKQDPHAMDMLEMNLVHLVNLAILMILVNLVILAILANLKKGCMRQKTASNMIQKAYMHVHALVDDARTECEYWARVLIWQ